MTKLLYDMIVIGGGPAGYTAALYAARSGLSVLVLEKLSAGGQMTNTEQIDNYPGFPEGIGGFELGERMQKGALRFGAENQFSEVKSVELSGQVKIVRTRKKEFQARTVVLAAGAYPRKTGVEGEDRFAGRGVAYCAACDGMFYKDKTVAVYGGGNSAVEDALLLSRICKKVYLIHRRDTLRATKVYQDALFGSSVELVWNSRVTAFLGDKHLSGVEIEDTKTGEKRELSLDGIFVSIGRIPDTGLFEGQVDMDEAGYLIADETTRTNLPGVFAAGDVRTKQLRQVITAAADGAAAAWNAEQYLAEEGC
ncbi:thioredoxin-disulfide reductase [Lachnoclostridium sp. An131]|uniref:thioredoxin-disulfide reductase n=1 Tax=Lachnoclostridium sp. An131 TaxID=1965555 RepID=UPI001FA93549